MTALKVEQINAAPVALSSAAASSSDVGAIVGGIVGGCFVPVLMLILWLSGAFAKKGCPSPFAKKAEDGIKVEMTNVA